jgi:DNA-directed RNA polymerase specialized sigma24 family protein
MKRDLPDLHAVRPEHIAIHERAINWARYVRVGTLKGWGMQPMFHGYRSSEVWALEAPRTPVDSLDGHRMEKAVSQLPEKHRDAIRWQYVFTWIPPKRVCRHLAVTISGLEDLIHDGRSILNNRSR